MIDSQPTRSQRAMRLVDILRTRGPYAYDSLCRCLEEDRTQLFLLRELNQALEREIGTPLLSIHPSIHPSTGE